MIESPETPVLCRDFEEVGELMFVNCCRIGCPTVCAIRAFSEQSERPSICGMQYEVANRTVCSVPPPEPRKVLRRQRDVTPEPEERREFAQRQR